MAAIRSWEPDSFLSMLGELGKTIACARKQPYVHVALERRPSRCPSCRHLDLHAASVHDGGGVDEDASPQDGMTGCASCLYRGRGVFASCDIPRGSLLLALPPLALVTGGSPAVLEAALVQKCALEAARCQEFAEQLWSMQAARWRAKEDDVAQEPARKRARLQRKRSITSPDNPDSEREDAYIEIAYNDKIVSQAAGVVAINAHRWLGKDSTGLGLWPWQAYTNHAEAGEANCAEIFIGEVLVMRATSDISAGSEIFSCYTSASASDDVRRATLDKCGVLSIGLAERQDFMTPQCTDESRELLKRLSSARTSARAIFEDALSAVHANQECEAHSKFREVLATSSAVVRLVDGSLRSLSTHAVAAACTELIQLLLLQLRAARCLGDMRSVANAHARLAKNLARERPMHVEVLAHWLGYLRAGGSSRAGWPYGQIEELSTFWFGKALPLTALIDWIESCGLGPQRL